jgi:hypothetical protein
MRLEKLDIMLHYKIDQKIFEAKSTDGKGRIGLGFDQLAFK